MKRCTKCETEKPESRFQVFKTKTGTRLGSWCRDCTNANQLRWKLRFPEKAKQCVVTAKARREAREPGYRRDEFRKTKYGLSKTQFADMRAAQNDLCALCDDKMTPPCVDHDHVSGKVRALLCRNCNNALGKLQDCPGLLLKAAAYLEHFEKYAGACFSSFKQQINK